MHGREPKAGDLLSYDDVARDQSAEFVAAFINAWNRRLPGLVCPLKLETGVPYFRTLGDDSSEVWQQKTDAGPQARWRAVEWNAIGNKPGAHEDKPAVAAVKFLGVMSGKPHCKPDSPTKQA